MSETSGFEIREPEQALRHRPSAQEHEKTVADRMTIGELARATGVTLRALRFYQSKGLLSPSRSGHGRVFGQTDRDRLLLILQGKRLGFTLHEIRDMLVERDRASTNALPISRKKCIEQINLLEHQRRAIELALHELRQIYSCMYQAILSANQAASGS